MNIYGIKNTYVLDLCSGSGSTAIAAASFCMNSFNFDKTKIQIEGACERLKLHQKSLEMFDKLEPLECGIPKKVNFNFFKLTLNLIFLQKEIPKTIQEKEIPKTIQEEKSKVSFIKMQ